MRRIEVEAPGLLTTVQDLGREGFGPMGVSPSGAADAVSLRVGNLLVGNDERAAGLEMTLLGGRFVFAEETVLALTGSDFGATLGAAAVPLWTAVRADAGATLRVGPTKTGARCYLCVQGGIDVAAFLGSASTHLLSGLGGHEGRALRKGDVLQIGASKGTLRARTVTAGALRRLVPRKTLRVTPGPQSEWFPESAHKIFYGSTYRVAEESNRMGLRLEGPALSEGAHGDARGDRAGKARADASGEERGDGAGKAPGDASGKERGQMISEGVSLGAIQVAAGGLPIILSVEQQTTGGYAKIANVISADLHSLGQLRPRDEVRFEPVSFDTARKLLIEQEKWLGLADLMV